ADAAAARGARVLCRVVAAGSAFDPTAADNGYGLDPEGVAETVRRGLARQGVELASIDRVVSGAAGGRPSDRAEGLLLRALWNGGGAPPILVPKATTGGWGGGHPAAAVLAASGPAFGPAP